MSINSPILPDDLRHYIDTVGYNESDLLKQNRKETKELGSISIMQVVPHRAHCYQYYVKYQIFKNA